MKLSFAVVGAAPTPKAASPSMSFDATVCSDAPVRALTLRAEVAIEPRRRDYLPSERHLLTEALGEPHDWSRGDGRLKLGSVTVPVNAFEGEAHARLDLPLTYDLEVTSARYCDALEGGEIPLVFRFSGTVFGEGPRGLEAEALPWGHEARYRLPWTLWRSMMDGFFPGGGFLRLDRESLRMLHELRVRHAFTDWNKTVQFLARVHA